MSARQWLEGLKIAIINHDEKVLETVANEPFPPFETLEELQEAQALLRQAETYLKERACLIKSSMHNLQKMKHFNAPLQEAYQHIDNLN